MEATTFLVSGHYLCIGLPRLPLVSNNLPPAHSCLGLALTAFALFFRLALIFRGLANVQTVGHCLQQEALQRGRQILLWEDRRRPCQIWLALDVPLGLYPMGWFVIFMSASGTPVALPSMQPLRPTWRLETGQKQV